MKAYQIGELIKNQIREYGIQRNYYRSKFLECENAQDLKVMRAAAEAAEKLEDQYIELYCQFKKIFKFEGDEQ